VPRAAALERKPEALGNLRGHNLPPPEASVTRTPTTTLDPYYDLPDLSEYGRNLSDLADAAGVVGIPFGALGMLRGKAGILEGGPRVIPHPTQEGMLQIVDAAGNEIGKIDAWMKRGMPELVVKFLGLSGEDLPEGASQLGGYTKSIGRTGMRSIVEQLLEHYPEAKTLQRLRATGATAPGGGFKRYTLPRRAGQFDAPRGAEVLERSHPQEDWPYIRRIGPEPGTPPFEEVPFEPRIDVSERGPSFSMTRESAPPPGPRREGDWYEFWRPGGEEPLPGPLTREARAPLMPAPAARPGRRR